MSVALTRHRIVIVRLLAVLTIVLGVNYLAWRWLAAVNWAVGWIAVPLVLAETGALVDTALFGATMWRATERPPPPPPDPAATVDVIVMAHAEPVAVLLSTVAAAAAIRYPHRTWILDDHERADVRQAARVARVGYLARFAHRPDGPRAPTAGDLDRALFATDGDYLLVLAAGRVPAPTILERTLGHFRDPEVAIVQVPRRPAVPFDDGSPLFAGPVQQGKDGWGAAFCCDADALLRREALLQLGIASCIKPVDATVRRVLRTAEAVLRNARQEARRYGPGVLAALDQVEAAVDEARRDVRAAGRRRTSLAEITYRFRMRVATASRGLVDADVVALRADFAESAPSTGWYAPVAPLLDSASLAWLSRQEMSPLRAMASVRALVEALDIDRVDRVGHVRTVSRPPMATLPVTEDIATVMGLHAMGWRSVYHPEPLVRGGENAATRPRRRAVAVTLQVLLREKPLVKRGLSGGQRLMYLATMGSCLVGFRALAYLAAPVLFLGFGVRALTGYGPELLLRLLPCLVASQVLAMVVGSGRRPELGVVRALWSGLGQGARRFADFPLWIRASGAAVANVALGRPLDQAGGAVWRPRNAARRSSWTAGSAGTAGSVGTAWPQRLAAALLVVAATVGVGRYLARPADSDAWALVVNLGWALAELVVLVACTATPRRRAAAR